MSKRPLNALKEMLIPRGRSCSSEVARYILSWKFSARDRKRMRLLNAKANEGTLTPDEHGELQAYCDLGNVLAIAQAKVRVARKSRAVA